MSILVDWEIKQEISNGGFSVDPFDEALINPASINFRLGNTFGYINLQTIDEDKKLIDNFRVFNDNIKEYWVNPRDKRTFITKNFKSSSYVLQSGEFILATTLETFHFGQNIAGVVKGRSSLGRLGLANSHQAGFIDPGFCAPITLELHNSGPHAILLEEGLQVGQLILYRVSTPDKHYGITGRYQNQEPGQGSKGV